MRTKHQTFVVQLENVAAIDDGGPERLCGRVENLGSGASTRFHSARALLRFLRNAPEVGELAPPTKGGLQ